MSNICRSACSIIILTLFLSATYILASRFTAQIYVLQAKNLIKKAEHGAAIHLLKKAKRLQPDDFKVYKSMGRAYHALAAATPFFKSFEPLKSGKEVFLLGKQINPFDSEIAFGLANFEERLEMLYPLTHPGENPYDALPYYHQVIQLSPNLLAPQKAYVNYLYGKNKPKLLIKAVTKLTRMYPDQYNSLKKQPLWSQEVRLAAKKGIHQSIAQKTSLSAAHDVMRSILIEEKNWPDAIYHYKKHWFYRKRTHPELFDNSRYHMELGRLYLESGQAELASESFTKAVGSSKSVKQTLASVYHAYKKKGQLEHLEQFYRKSKELTGLSLKTDILYVQTLIDLQKYDRAKQILHERNAKTPNALTYFWLATIAEKEKNWKAAEDAIQNASHAEPTNNQYYTFYSRILTRQKRIPEAEDKIDLAIQFSANPQAALFHQRALIRVQRNNYPGAINDWNTAIKLEPQNPRFLIYAADTLQKVRNVPLATAYLEKAVKLSPRNKTYRKKLEAAKIIRQ